MSDPVIKVENLSKSYFIGHKSQERYTALRDVMANKVKNFGKRVLHPFKSSEGGLIAADETEEFWALKDVSFEVKRGDRVGIIGRNGAGKSTLLKILSRITEPTSGRIEIDGRVASLLEVGTGFHPELTGRENIFLNGAILGMTKVEIKRKFDEIVAFAEIEKFLDTPVKRYSSGMYVRLAFAVAAHLEPEILIVDEVLAVGDAQFQKKCLGKMEEVGREGRTVLFVSHNMTAVRSMCKRAILLKDGGIITHSETGEVINSYNADLRENAFIRTWPDKKSAPQNKSILLLKARVCDDHGKLLEEVFTHSPLNLEIEYMVKSDGAFAGLALVVYDNENNCVFSSINNKEGSWYGKPMPSGLYESVCKIPGNFFNSGWFNVTIVIFCKEFSDPIMVSDALRLEILDSDVLRLDYFGEWAGVVRPDLKWSTKERNISRIQK